MPDLNDSPANSSASSDEDWPELGFVERRLGPVDRRHGGRAGTGDADRRKPAERRAHAIRRL